MGIPLYVLDMETFYNQDFSLSKLTTESYVRDCQFEVIGFSISVNGAPAKWYSGSFEYLKQILIRYELDTAAVAAHNSMFDMTILSWVFGIRPKIILDTLSMARGVHGAHGGLSLAKLAERYSLGEKGAEVINAKGKRRLDFTREELVSYGEYCCNDVMLTTALYNKLIPHYTKAELKIIDLTIRMFTEPVFEVDVPLLEQSLINLRFKKGKLLIDAGVDKKDLMSNNKFAELLKQYGVEPPRKISKTTGKEAFAFAKTDQGFKELLEHPNEEVQILASARMENRSTLAETRMETFIEIGKRGLIPVPLNYCGAHTSRWSAGSGQRINFQNIPSRGVVSPLKNAIMAPKGRVVWNADASQIEARILAWFSGQDDLVEDFVNKRDIYKKMASRIYNESVENINKEQRFLGKTAVLGCGFGMSGKRFREQVAIMGVKISEEESSKIVSTYRDTNQNIVALWRFCGRVIQAIYEGKSIKFDKDCATVVKGGVQLPSGHVIQYPELQPIMEDGRRNWIIRQGKKISHLNACKLTENLIQGLARCVVAEQMLLVSKRYKVALTVHDSIVGIAREEEAEEALEYVLECMRYCPPWATGLPLDAEAGYSRRYGEC